MALTTNLTHRLVGLSNQAWLVGYESPSQFSREYRRLFGAAPLQNVESLRQMGATL